MISVNNNYCQSAPIRRQNSVVHFLGTFTSNFGTWDFWISNLQSLKVPTCPSPNALPCPSSLRWEAQATCWLPVMAKRLCPRLQNVRIPTLPQMICSFNCPPQRTQKFRHFQTRTSALYRMHACCFRSGIYPKICKLYILVGLAQGAVQRAKFQPGLL